MKKISLFILYVVICACTTNLFAWGTTGHRTIAEVAQRNLDPETEQKVNLILEGQSMAYWSNWADYIKSDTLDTWKHTSPWHYVNTPANMEKADFVKYIKDLKVENVYSQIPQMITILKDEKKSNEDKKYALAFLIHLVGDMHQPMHTGRAEDLGGNKIPITWFGRETNLHSLWDSPLVDSEKYSFTEYATVLNVCSPERKNEIQSGTLEEWMYDSHEIANMIYAITPAGSELSYNYNYKVRPIVDSQLQKAGLRLAKILNDLW